MRLLFFIKHSSIRTKFFLFTLGVFVSSNLFVTLYYPYTVYNNELIEVREQLRMDVADIFHSVNSHSQGDETDEYYINSMFAYIESLDNIEYISTRYLGNEYTFPGDKLSLAQIDSFKLNSIHYWNEKNVLALSAIVKDKTRIGEIEFKIGLEATHIILAEKIALYQSFERGWCALKYINRGIIQL